VLTHWVKKEKETKRRGVHPGIKGEGCGGAGGDRHVKQGRKPDQEKTGGDKFKRGKEVEEVGHFRACKMRRQT